MEILNKQGFHTWIKEAQAAAFSGWDFSWVAGRMIQEDPPWDYPALVRSYITNVHSLLDMGTGDGEFLATLAD